MTNLYDYNMIAKEVCKIMSSLELLNRKNPVQKLFDNKLFSCYYV